MAAELAPIRGIPAALHRAEKDMPFVVYQGGVVFQLLQVDVEAGLWVIRVRFQPGVAIQRHRHTGEVFAFTLKGSWKYLEYLQVNTAGSYLYEPAGSIHTLHVPVTNSEVTDVWFAIRGANLNLGTRRARSRACWTPGLCWRSTWVFVKRAGMGGRT